MSPQQQECEILNEFWIAEDEIFKTNMLILFLKTHYNIITNTPYNYISLFTDDNLRNFILDI